MSHYIAEQIFEQILSIVFRTPLSLPGIDFKTYRKSRLRQMNWACYRSLSFQARLSVALLTDPHTIFIC